MNPIRKKRLYLIGLMLGGLGLATFLALKAFDDNLMFFYPPADVVAGKAPKDHPFRVGGLVVKGSVRRDGTHVEFDLTDNAETIRVAYDGILPDLFREGQGIVATGTLTGPRLVTASEVLAKHDENYMPPEVAKTLKTAHAEGIQGMHKEAAR